jgi:uncharacterized membrane protein YuzA (DUF378 family)
MPHHYNFSVIKTKAKLSLCLINQALCHIWEWNLIKLILGHLYKSYQIYFILIHTAPLPQIKFKSKFTV